MANSQNILVLGAGELGTAIITHLSNLSPPGTKITILLRPSSITSPSPSKAAELASLLALSPTNSISLLPFDISSSTVSSLADAVKPFETVISCTGFTAGPGSQLKIAKAVLEAGVKRFYPWQFGVDYDVIGRGCGLEVFDEQLDVRDLLRAQESQTGTGTEWVIVSVGLFMSFLFEGFWGVVDFGAEGEEQTAAVTVRALGSWDNKMTVTTPEDIGRLTAMIVFAEPRARNQVAFIGGQTLTYAELADTVGAVTGREVKREVWGVQRLQADLAEAQVKGEEGAVQLGKYRVVFAKGTGCSWGLEGTWGVERGVEMVGVEEFMVENGWGKK